MRDSPPDLDLIARLLRQVLAVTKARSVKLGGRRPNQHKLDPSLGTATLVRASDEFAARVAPISRASQSEHEPAPDRRRTGQARHPHHAWWRVDSRIGAKCPPPP